MYVTIKQAAEEWGISEKDMLKICTGGKFYGARREGKEWKVLVDGPTTSQTSCMEELDDERDILYERGFILDRFMPCDVISGYIYNSNALSGSTLRRRETTMLFCRKTVDKNPTAEKSAAYNYRKAWDFVYQAAKKNVPPEC